MTRALWPLRALRDELRKRRERREETRPTPDEWWAMLVEKRQECDRLTLELKGSRMLLDAAVRRGMDLNDALEAAHVEAGREIAALKEHVTDIRFVSETLINAWKNAAEPVGVKDPEHLKCAIEALSEKYERASNNRNEIDAALTAWKNAAAPFGIDTPEQLAERLADDPFDPIRPNLDNPFAALGNLAGWWVTITGSRAAGPCPTAALALEEARGWVDAARHITPTDQPHVYNWIPTEGHDAGWTPFKPEPEWHDGPLPMGPEEHGKWLWIEDLTDSAGLHRWCGGRWSPDLDGYYFWAPGERLHIQGWRWRRATVAEIETWGIEPKEGP